MTNLAKMIAAYRQKYDLTQQQLSEDMGITISRLSSMERNGTPDLETTMKLIDWMIFDPSMNQQPQQPELGIE